MRLFHRERISTKVTLQNTIYRSIFNQRLFGNDPDVFLLRVENIELNQKQKYALTIINALFGSVLMTSDNIATYNDYQKSVLTKALDLFKNAKVISATRDGRKRTRFSYELNGQKHNMVYNTKKGELENE